MDQNLSNTNNDIEHSKLNNDIESGCSKQNKIENDELNDFGKYITGQYELLKRIFSYLPTKSLSSAACVCREWNYVSKLEFSKRAIPHCFTWLLLDSLEIESQMINTFKEGFNGIPYYVLIFQPETSMNINVNIKLKRKRNSDNVKPKSIEEISERLLSNKEIKLLNIFTNGAIGLNDIRPDQRSRMRIFYQTVIFSGLLLPKMPDVHISLFDSNDSSALSKSQDSTPIKCLIFFNLIYDNKQEVYEFIEFFRKRQKEPFVVAGGKVEHINMKNRNLPNPTFYGIALSGNSVRASTLIIPKNCRNKEKVIEILQSFTPPKGKHVLAINFTCVARVDLPHLDKNLFNEIFPNIPFTGCYVGGEICLQPDQSSSKRLFLEYTTVILFLAFGPEE